jgi:hypothetical protein
MVIPGKTTPASRGRRGRAEVTVGDMAASEVLGVIL